MKIALLGCGLRTPLLAHGFVHADLSIDELAMFDVDAARARLMAKLGEQIGSGGRVRFTAANSAGAAIDGADFVLSCIRVGDMESRARDERLALQCGFAGQETTGPAGFAMALRTIPVALEQARLVEQRAPRAWIISMTNPAGIITQAISRMTGTQIVGVCDTPTELIAQIGRALGEPLSDVECDYFGLNHLGWISAVRVRGEDRMDLLLADDELLRRLYPAALFPPALIRALRLIPTEYVFFYYSQERAALNQKSAGATRGEELATLNREVWRDLERSMATGDARGALEAYRRYLNRRNASYLKLEGSAESAFQVAEPNWDPFAAETGYHRIAVDTVRALAGNSADQIILNVPNQGAIDGFAPDDVVEVPCAVDRGGARPVKIGPVPDSVRGLMLAVKHYERLTIHAATARSCDNAAVALMANPIVGSWEAARNFVGRLEAR